jgi:hypothetical protein
MRNQAAEKRASEICLGMGACLPLHYPSMKTLDGIAAQGKKAGLAHQERFH